MKVAVASGTTHCQNSVLFQACVYLVFEYIAFLLRCHLKCFMQVPLTVLSKQEASQQTFSRKAIMTWNRESLNRSLNIGMAFHFRA